MRSGRQLFLPALALAACFALPSPTHARTGGDVRIMRDAYGVPHIFAQTSYDLYYGFGYALAEDQLYQLELLKRTARGRLAEVLGRSYLPVDIASRTHIDIGSLQRQYDALPADKRAIFRGMADGLNARLAIILKQPTTLLPRGFIDADFLPERWSPVDILAVYQHSMVNRFSDLNGEVDNLALLSRLRRDHGDKAGWALFDQLRWTQDPEAPTTIAKDDAHVSTHPTFAAPTGSNTLPNRLSAITDMALQSSTPGTTAHASNAWVASPSRTATGEAVLVNGPQMGYFASSYIWSVGLHGPGFDIVGSGPVGSPWLIFGTNGAIGWGATAGLGDTVDIYQERLKPGNPHQYRFKGKWRAMTWRDASIPVKGEAPVPLRIWSTVHGIVDLSNPTHNLAYTRRRTWEGREVSSLIGWIDAMRAKDYASWRMNVAKVAIGVNNYYVDRQGNTAYQFLGLFPIRPKDQDFRLPATGDGSMEWRGFHAPLDNPHLFNPRSGLIANWNNKPQTGYANSDFMFWGRLDRVSEIDKAAGSGTFANADAVWNLIAKTSFQDVTARPYLALIQAHRAELMQHAPEPTVLLLDWDGTLSNAKSAKSTPGFILYRAFMTQLLADLFAPVLPADQKQRIAADAGLLSVDPVFPSMGAKIAYTALSSPQDSPLLAHRKPATLLANALDRAWRTTVAKFGADPARWDDPATPHEFALLGYAGVPTARSDDVVSLPILMNRGTENDRIVFRDGKVDYCDVTPPGQSGFVAPDGTRSPHARDQLDLYASFACKRQWLSRTDVERNAVTREVIRAQSPDQ